VTAFVDTNILVRHLTDDPPQMAARATAYLVACAESTGIGRVASFDQSLDRVRTIERVEPPHL
jgi:predicted nucleic acid-binding protein